MNETLKIPMSQKYSLSINEMGLLLGIGSHTLRKYIEKTKECNDCIITVGSTIRIKKEKFLRYLDENQIVM